jgi:hypothetical protein
LRIADCGLKNGDKKTRRIERRHHKVDRLPPALRDELARRFQAGETYEALAGWLQDSGYPVARSSVHRWGAQFQRHLERLRAWREGAATIVAGLAGKPATELNEAAEQTAVQMLFEALIDLGGAAGGENGEDAPDLAKRTKILSQVSHALSGLGYSSANRERLKLAFDEKFSGQKQAAAAEAQKALEASGAGKESVTAVVNQILGIGGS